MGNQAKHLAAKPCILQALLFFAYCSLQASSKTFTLSEDGSLQVEGYNVNTVFGNVTAVGDMRVDGGSIKLLHADKGTTFQMMENTTDSVAFRSSRSTSAPILSLHTRNLDHSVHVAGKLRVDGVLQVDRSSSALKVRNMILEHNNPRAFQHLVPDMNSKFNVTFRPGNTLTTDIPHGFQVDDIIYMLAPENQNAAQLHMKYWVVSFAEENQFRLRGFVFGDFNSPPTNKSVSVYPTKLLSAISTVAGEESMVFHGNSEVQGQSLTRGSVYVGDHLVVENGVDVTRGEMGVKLKSSAERALKYTTDPGRFPINSISYSPDEIIVSLITEANITQDSIVIFLDVDRSCSALGNTRQIFAVKQSLGKSVVLRALDSAPFANCSKTGAIKVISEGGSVVSIAEVKNGSTVHTRRSG